MTAPRIAREQKEGHTESLTQDFSKKCRKCTIRKNLEQGIIANIRSPESTKSWAIAGSFVAGWWVDGEVYA